MSEQRDAIAKLIAAGDDRAAFAQLRETLGWPHGKEISAAELPKWVALLGELAGKRGAAPLAELVDAVVRDPDSPDRVYELGYALIDAGAPAIAATVLWRCLELVGESEEVVCELVSALESALAYPDALDVLAPREALRRRSFLCQYLYGFNGAMSGRLAITREVLPALVPDSPETTSMCEALSGIVERADQVGSSLDDRDLRGWHYVLTGSLLVHQSPYGFDDPMRGRYAWISDSMARVATGLAALRSLVEPLGLPCIYVPPGRDHEIVAHAASMLLGLPIAEWPTIGVPAPGLVIAYDVAGISPTHAAQLIHRRADQVLFVHASPWTVDHTVAPDVTTLLYQTLAPPWPADERTVADIGEELAASPLLADEDRVADDPAGWSALVARAWPPTLGPRSRLWAGGPVPSNRFA